MKALRGKMRSVLLSLLAMGLWPAAAAGAEGTPVSAWDRTDFSEMRLVAAQNRVGDDGSVRLGLHFRLSPGWKMYWRSPGDAGAPPEPDWSASENLAAVDMAWPAPTRFFEAADLETRGYTEEVVFPLTATAVQPDRPLVLDAVVDYQACERICIPVTAAVSLTLPPGKAGPTAFTRLVDRFTAQVPKAPESAGITVDAVGVVPGETEGRLVVRLSAASPFDEPDLFVEGPIEFRFPAPVVDLAKGGRTATIEVPVADAGALAGETLTFTLRDGLRTATWQAAPQPLEALPGADGGTAPAALAVILGLALLGGLILNLMPCVLPVLSIKVLGLVGHGGGDRRRVAQSFIASAAGIVASFVALAAGAIALKLSGEAVGWGMQFQEPLFLVFLVLVLTLFAANLFGFYEINLPSWLGRLGSGHGAQGSLAAHFSTGIFATLLATPCSAPFLGTAIGFALARGPLEILSIFIALGVGMALPYLAIAAVPGLATRLPRPGAWMIRVRWVLGLLLLGTAAWLLWVIAAQTAAVATALVIAALMAATIAVIALASGRPPAIRRAGAGIVAALGVAAFVVPQIRDTVPMVAEANAAWRPFEEAAIGGLVDAGKTVFVDVTADWCVTCQVNKTLVIDRGAVAERLAADDVVAMRADWTRPDPRIAAFLTRFDRYGIPFNVAFGPGAPDGIPLPELLTPGDVLDAIERAGGTVTAEAADQPRR